jgi:FlaA1/EpsC-like NDP-sugar epimerase
MQDAIRIAISIFVSSALLFMFSKLTISYRDAFILDSVIIILYATFSFLSMLSYRMGVKFLFSYAKNFKMVKKNVVIFGAGEAGVATKRVLEHDTQNNISLLAFIDDDRKKNNKVLDGIPIINFNELTNFVKLNEVDELVIASFTITPQRKNDIVDFCLDHDIKVLNVPVYSKWTEGKFNSKQLQNVKIDDLLERNPIVINSNQIRTQVKGKRVLVTGAAGSIGSEIVRQLINYAPELIVLCDQAETPLHSLELELQEKKHHINCIPI